MHDLARPARRAGGLCILQPCEGPERLRPQAVHRRPLTQRFYHTAECACPGGPPSPPWCDDGTIPRSRRPPAQQADLHEVLRTQCPACQPLPQVQVQAAAPEGCRNARRLDKPIWMARHGRLLAQGSSRGSDGPSIDGFSETLREHPFAGMRQTWNGVLVSRIRLVRLEPNANVINPIGLGGSAHGSSPRDDLLSWVRLGVRRGLGGRGREHPLQRMRRMSEPVI